MNELNSLKHVCTFYIQNINRRLAEHHYSREMNSAILSIRITLEEILSKIETFIRLHDISEYDLNILRYSVNVSLSNLTNLSL